MSISARNHLKGKITDLILGGVMTHVTIKVGQNIIESVITRQSAVEMNLKKGDTMTAVVKATECRNADVALSKRTYMRERMNLEFRAEIFNLTNTPPLGSPNVVLGSAGFGSIISAGDPRVIQFGLKLNF
jgi:molybdopterin-binding protein